MISCVVVASRVRVRWHGFNKPNISTAKATVHSKSLTGINEPIFQEKSPFRVYF